MGRRFPSQEAGAPVCLRWKRFRACVWDSLTRQTVSGGNSYAHDGKEYWPLEMYCIRQAASHPDEAVSS
jgi:hypothetical protein